MYQGTEAMKYKKEDIEKHYTFNVKLKVYI